MRDCVKIFAEGHWYKIPKNSDERSIFDRMVISSQTTKLSCWHKHESNMSHIIWPILKSLKMHYLLNIILLSRWPWYPAVSWRWFEAAFSKHPCYFTQKHFLNAIALWTSGPSRSKNLMDSVWKPGMIFIHLRDNFK